MGILGNIKNKVTGDKSSSSNKSKRSSRRSQDFQGRKSSGRSPFGSRNSRPSRDQAGSGGDLPGIGSPKGGDQNNNPPRSRRNNPQNNRSNKLRNNRNRQNSPPQGLQGPESNVSGGSLGPKKRNRPEMDDSGRTQRRSSYSNRNPRRDKAGSSSPNVGELESQLDELASQNETIIELLRRINKNLKSDKKF